MSTEKLIDAMTRVAESNDNLATTYREFIASGVPASLPLS